MIHMLQCLCGPERHAIYAVLYDDEAISPTDAMDGMMALVEMQIDHQIMRRRCEICDKDIVEFWYEDRVAREQDWDKAVAQAKLSEVEQSLARETVRVTRKAERN